MGCFYSKSSAVKDSKEGVTKKFQSYSTRPSELNVLRLNSTRKIEEGRVKDALIDGGHVKSSLIDKKANGSGQLYFDHGGNKKIEKPELAVVDHIGPGRVPKAIEGEQVAAGWPAWLSSVAGEAIKGWIPRSANTFEKLHKVKDTACTFAGIVKLSREKNLKAWSMLTGFPCIVYFKVHEPNMG